MRPTTALLGDTRTSYKKYLVLLGGILIYLPIGVPWYFGNLTTYINSYLYADVESEADLGNPQWVFSAFFILFTVGVPASGYLVEWIGVRPTLLLALVVHSGGMFFSYFAIQHSMQLLVLVFGAIGGLGAGLAYGPPLPVIVKWMPQQDVGWSSGVLLAGFGGGATLYNQLITVYVNPDNHKPDLIGSNTRYFSHPDILSRIPTLFLLLGSLTVGLQMAGLMLLRAPSDDELTKSPETPELREPQEKNHPISKRAPIFDRQSPPRLVLDQTLPTLSKNGTDSASKQNYQHQPRLNNHHQKQQNSNFPVASVTNAHHHSIREATTKPINDIRPDMSPRQVLTSVYFYILWTALGLNHYGYIIKSNFYKEFGQSQIADDHFLTLTGTVSTIGVALARVFWGKMADCFGVKDTLIVFMASTTATTAFWYLCLFHGPIVYMVIVIVLSFVLSGAFILFPVAALKTFGETHYATNHGLILSSQIVMNLISPVANGAILSAGSWFWLFTSIAIANIVGTVLCLFLKDCR